MQKRGASEQAGARAASADANTHQDHALCDGRALRELVASGTAWLEAHIDFVNSLNVFPVPDGDTGTNMYLTMQAALREMATISESSVSVAARASAHGALMGARGNSGVILSQIWRGIAKQIDGKDCITASDFALALQEGATTAYKGVMRPVEGTILTVAREAADAGIRAAGQRDDLKFVLDQVVLEAGRSLARTPSLLPVLRDAGVVDAGGQGLCLILEGMLRHVRGEELPKAAVGQVRAGPKKEAVPAEKYGYDIQFLLHGEDLPIDEIREAIMGMGNSVLVVGDEHTLKVHVHSVEPGRIFTYAISKGTLHDVVLENMQEQAQRFFAEKPPEKRPTVAPMGDISTVVVVTGTGLRRVFESLGAGAIVDGGQSMNPSTEDILQAISEQPTSKVIVLPNNSNVILTAQQAQRLADKEVAVVQTKTIPQGISALLAFNYDADLKVNADLMERAASQIQTIEITNAVRSVKIGGMEVQKGQFIALHNGELIEAGNDLESVAQAVLKDIDVERYDIITLYWGSDVGKEQAESLASWISSHYPEQEVELVEGGQPYYHYIISAE